MSEQFVIGLGQHEEADGLFAKTGKALTYGTSAALVSAGTSFVNTAIALGNVFGEEGELVETEEAVQSMLGEDAAEYYRNNSEFVDALGLGVGSMVPGLGAVKAARAFSSGVLATRTTKLATGIRQAMFSDERLRAMEVGILKGRLGDTVNANRKALIAGNFTQNFAESAIYETATLLTMNQSTALDSEGLGYFGAIANNLDSAVAGLGFGTVIGGAIGTFSQTSALKKFLRTDELKTMEPFKFLGAVDGRLLGDEVGTAIEDVITARGILDEIATLPAAERELKARQVSLLEGRLAATENEVIRIINSRSTSEHDLGSLYLDLVKSEKMPMAAINELLAGSSQVTGLKYTMPTRGVSGAIVDDAVADLPRGFVKQYLGTDIDVKAGVARMKRDIFHEGKFQNALPEEMVLDSIGLLEADDIAFIMQSASENPANYTKRITPKDQRGRTIPIEQLTPAQRAKLQLPKQRKGSKPLSKVTTVIDLRDELMRFANEFDPVYRNMADTVSADLAEIERRVSVGEATPDDVLVRSMELMEFTTSMNHPSQLLATAFRKFNAAELDPRIAAKIDGATSEYRALYEYLSNNKLLAKKYGTTTSYFNHVNGKLANYTPTPFPSDLGLVHISKGTVTAGKSLKVTVTPDMDIRNLNPTEAQAVYAWANSMRGATVDMFEGGAVKKSWEVALKTDNIPVLEALLRNYNFQSQGAVKLFDPEIGARIEVKDVAELATAIRKAKAQLINDKGTKGGNVLLQDLSMYANVDDTYRDAVIVGKIRQLEQGEQPFNAADRLPQEYGSEFFASEKLITTQTGTKGTFETFKPVHSAIRYDSAVFNNLGQRMSGAAEVTIRKQAVQSLRESIGKKIFGKRADRIVTYEVGSAGRIHMATDLTKQDQTTGLFSALNAETGSAQSLVKLASDTILQIAKEEGEEIDLAFRAVAENLTANKEALMEYSVLRQSVLRQDKYKLLPDSNLNLDESVLSVYESFGIKLPDIVNAEVYTANGLTANAKAGYLITASLKDRMDAEVAKLVFDEETSKAITAAMAQEDVAVFNGVAKELQANVDQVVANLKNMFGQAASVQGAKQIHEVQHYATYAFLKKSAELNRQWKVSAMHDIATATNYPSDIDGDILYPEALNFEKLPHLAVVELATAATDPWASKSKGYIYAKTQEELKRKITHFRTKYSAKEVKITEMGNIIDRAKAANEYKAELALTENKINALIQNEGKQWNIAPEFNPNEVSDYIEAFKLQRRNIRIQAQKLIYGQEIAAYEHLDKAATQLNATGSAKTTAAKSAYLRNINQLLGLKDTDVHGWWDNFNESTDKLVSKQIHAIRGKYLEVTQSGNWEALSETLNNYGLPKLVTGEEDWIISDVGADKGLLTEVVARSNAMLSFAMLRIDTAHAIVNMLSMPIMGMPELRALKDTIASMPDSVKQRIGAATSVPYDDAGSRMPANSKILLQSVKNLHSPQGKDFMNKLVERGIATQDGQEMMQALDALTYNPAKEAGPILTQLKRAGSLLTKAGDMSERTVKFISADMARQVLELAGIKESNPMYWATIHSFTSRMHGNYRSIQRPTLFQGWAGQAISLFQTYQFNLIQQFTRHLGDNKAAARQMIAYQMGIFGTQSLPGFELANNILAENSLGEKDFYSVTGEALDTPVAEFLVYGGASSLTRPLFGGKGIDFFNRGNLTPRTPILLPTKFSEIPLVGFWSNMTSTLANAFGDIADGVGPKQAILEAIAHNGMTRPLGGAAQLMLGQRTTRQGTTLLNYGDIDFATRIAKYMGTSTLDESIVIGAMYRSQGYRAVRMENLEELGKTVRSKIREGSVTSQDVTNLLGDYAARGGRTETFNRWMSNQFAKANESSIYAMQEGLNSPEGVYLQSVIGNKIDDYDTAIIAVNEEAP